MSVTDVIVRRRHEAQNRRSSPTGGRGWPAGGQASFRTRGGRARHRRRGLARNGPLGAAVVLPGGYRR